MSACASKRHIWSASSWLRRAASAPPPPPQLDSSVPGGDATVPAFDGGSGPFGRPDGGPRLPPVDREIVLPYFGDPEEEPLEVEGGVGTLDVFFSIDTTGSFSGEIDNLQSSLASVILPELRDRVPDVQLGVGRFEDFPTDPFGGPDDRPFALLSEITASDSRVAGAVASLDQPLGNGGDIRESGAEALFQIATGEGYPGLVPAYDGSGLGGVGFRADALRVVVHVTDAPSHVPTDYAGVYDGTHDIGEAATALHDLGVRALGIASGEAARGDLERLAIGTGAVVEPVDGMCATGIDGSSRPASGDACPLVFDLNPDGSGLGSTVVDAITDLLSIVAYDEVWGETDDGLGLVRAIEAVEATPAPMVPAPTLADLRPADGIDDTFVDVGVGTRLRFRAVLRNRDDPARRLRSDLPPRAADRRRRGDAADADAPDHRPARSRGRGGGRGARRRERRRRRRRRRRRLKPPRPGDARPL